jgi:hypothetical protein
MFSEKKVCSDLQAVGCAILHGEKGLDTTAEAVPNDHDNFDFERADSVLNGGTDAGEFFL